MEVFEQKMRELVKRDPSAAVSLLRRTFATDVEAFVARRVPASAREDVAAQVWLGVVEGIGRFTGVDGSGRPIRARTWLLSIGEHKANDFLRWQYRRGRLELAISRLIDVADGVPGALIDRSSKRPSRQVVAEERRHIVTALMEELAPDERLLLQWRYVDGDKPDTWFDRIEREGCAAELGVAEEMASFLAASGEERRVLRKRLRDRLTQRCQRAAKAVADAWRKQGRRADDEVGA